MLSAKNPSSEYIKLIKFYRNIHKEGSVYQNKLKLEPKETYNGRSTLRFIEILKKIIKKHNCKTLLDYGSGKGDFYFENKKYEKKIYPPIKDYWKIKPTLFDPGINDYKKPKNKKYDIVISIDVLEHIPKQDLYWVLNEIFSFSKDIVFLNIACFPTTIMLEDGRNAHVSLFHPMWWYGFITAISNKYNLKIFLVCSYAENKKIKFISFGINEDFNNYK